MNFGGTQISCAIAIKIVAPAERPSCMYASIAFVRIETYWSAAGLGISRILDSLANTAAFLERCPLLPAAEE
jgi:hypothetical protein